MELDLITRLDGSRPRRACATNLGELMPALLQTFTTGMQAGTLLFDR